MSDSDPYVEVGVDLTNCDREPIRSPGAIQPHGVLVALDADGLVVVASANATTLLGVEPARALGRPLAALVGADLARLVLEHAEAPAGGGPLVLEAPGLEPGAALAGRTVEVRAHRSGARTVVELESLGRTRPTPLSYRSAQDAMAHLVQADSVEALASHLAHEVREVAGFDRVMVYRFDAHWNGEVIAEERRGDLNPFLGLHYPASDIPAQARELYTVNWTRLIADVAYRPVPLHPPLDPATGAPLDLSHATLRSVSPIHVEYLSHMGVTASMSVSLVVEGRLWGLVACHHYSGPHRPTHDERAAAQLLGQVASQVVAARERADARESALATQAGLARVMGRMAAGPESPLLSLLADPELLTLMRAGGAALMYDGVLTTRGTVLDDRLLGAVAAALEAPGRDTTHTDQAALLVPELAAHGDVGAGVLRVGSAPDRWLLLLRPELEQVVEWGGDPTNKRLAAAEGPEVRLSPRRSFERWREVVRGRSAPWCPWKVEAADALGRQLTSLLLARSREQIVMAESIQRSVILEETPQFAGVVVAARYQAASTYQLGGDWWDAFELPDGRLAFVVGDVAGHGVSAASTMTEVRTALRAYLYESRSAALALDRLDRLMADLLDQRTATAIVVVLDAAARRAEIASAGHLNPFLVVDGTATAIEIDPRPMLGLGAGRAVSTAVELEPGAIVLLYTDGMVERRGVALDAGIERLRDTAARRRSAAALDGWLEQLLELLDDPGTGAGEGRREDDITLLAIQLAP